VECFLPVLTAESSAKEAADTIFKIVGMIQLRISNILSLIHKEMIKPLAIKLVAKHDNNA